MASNKTKIGFNPKQKFFSKPLGLNQESRNVKLAYLAKMES